MGQYTPEKEDQIYEIYQKTRTYSQTATEAGVDSRTVRSIVEKKRGRTVVDQFPQFQNPSKLHSEKIKPRGKDTSKELTNFFKEASNELCLASFPETAPFAEIFEKHGNGTKEQFFEAIQALMAVEGRLNRLLPTPPLPPNWMFGRCGICGKVIAAFDVSDELGNMLRAQKLIHPRCSRSFQMSGMTI